MRFRWAEIKPQVQRDLPAGQYRLQPLRRTQTADCECMELWTALDALVLKALAMVLNRRLDFPRSCYHVPGKAHRLFVSVVRAVEKEGEAKRGAKAALRHIFAQLQESQFVFRSDVKSYYASNDHAVLLALVWDRIDDRRVMDLVAQCLHRSRHQPGLSAVAGDGGDLSGASGSPHGGHRVNLCPVYG